MTTPVDDRERWVARFCATRARTEALAAPLSPEDQQLQSMPACSPTKWHRAHTTWFFEEFLLGPAGVAAVHPTWRYLFNSYYEEVGPRHPRPLRGLLSRPRAEEIAEYRRVVEDRVIAWVRGAPPDELARRAPILELGLAHEEQHQELLLTDALHALSHHPDHPRYRDAPAPDPATTGAAPPMTFVEYAGGLVEIGHTGEGFAFDNEGPAHRAWLPPFAMAERLVTLGEVRAFADAGGYRAASWWLSEGWDVIRAHAIDAPAYVTVRDGEWWTFGLDGLGPADLAAPAAFLSFYEADAIARWLGGRLPTEHEWEHAARGRPCTGSFVGASPATSALRPARAVPGQWFGEVWQWTRSAYAPYPGFSPAPGAVGEYNGKFMLNQQVLRGGSCFTPAGHVRATYRNFWPAATRFQVTGLRIARDHEPGAVAGSAR